MARVFSELALRSNGLLLPFQAEYEGSIPFTRSNNFNGLPAAKVREKWAG
jgi:hypothetical protein